MAILDPGFLKAPRKYLVQSLLGAAVVFVLLYFVETVTHAAIVAALGSSTFIVLATPHSIMATPRRLLGRHAVGLAVGTVGHFVLLNGLFASWASRSEVASWVVGALAVGLALLLMTATNTEHSPAAATALGMVTHTWSAATVLFIVLFAVALVLIRWLLRRYLIDLLPVSEQLPVDFPGTVRPPKEAVSPPTTGDRQ